MRAAFDASEREGFLAGVLSSSTDCIKVLDLDGTLLDTAPGLTQALNWALGDIGRSPLALTDVKPMIGDGVTALIERAVAEQLTSAQIKQAVQQWQPDWYRT